MTVHFMDIPDDPRQRILWLERQLVGVHLGELVAELLVLHASTASQPLTLAQALADTLPAVVRAGLAQAPAGAVTQLLTHPRLLLELQEALLESDSAYWNARLEADAELAALHSANAPVVPPRQSHSSWIALLMGMAAMLLVGLGLVASGVVTLGTRRAIEAVQSWGWSRDGAIPTTGSAGDYYDALARSARQWYDRKPEDVPALVDRINEYRAGCSRLLTSPHEPLRRRPREDVWLTGRCHRWGYRLDQVRDALESGKLTPTQARAEVDELTERVILNLESRAEHMRSLRL